MKQLFLLIASFGIFSAAFAECNGKCPSLCGKTAQEEVSQEICEETETSDSAESDDSSESKSR